MSKKFDLNKVKIAWDFSMGDFPALLVAYIDNDKTYILKSCTSGTGMIDTKELERLWEIATDPQKIKEIGETQLKNLKKLYGVIK